MKTEIFAPPPIPTGHDYADNGTFGRKTANYLDICSQYAAGTLYCYVWTISLFALILIYFIGWSAGLFPLYIVWGMSILGSIYVTFKSPPLPNMRLNRQRREVFIWLNKQKRGWFVNWETIGAKGKEVVTLSQAGRSTQAIMGIHAFDPKEQKEIAVFSVMTGTMNIARAQWEAIRRFMELGAEYCPDSMLGCKHPIKDGVIGRFFSQLKQGQLLNALGNLFLIVFFGWFLLDIYNYFKLREIPDFTDPEILAWSTPLPKEKWAKPSASLVEAIKTQEQKLMAEGSYKLEDCQYYQPKADT